MKVKLRKLLNKRIKAGSGVDILMLGLTVTIVVSLISLVQNTRTIMIHRRDMIDANLTLSLLDVDVADKELLGNSNIIAFNGTKSLRQDINTKADKIDLITEFVRSMSENFSDTTSHGDLLIKNRSLFGKKGFMVISEIAIVDKKPVMETHEYAMTQGNKFGVYQLYGVRYKLTTNKDENGNEVVDETDETSFGLDKLDKIEEYAINPSTGIKNKDVAGSTQMSWTPGSTWYEVKDKWKPIKADEIRNLGIKNLDGSPYEIDAGLMEIGADEFFQIDKNAFYDFYKSKGNWDQVNENILQQIDSLGMSTGQQYQTEIDSTNVSNKAITDCTIAVKCDIYYDITNEKNVAFTFWHDDFGKSENEKRTSDQYKADMAEAKKKASTLDHVVRIRTVQLKRNDGADI